MANWTFNLPNPWDVLDVKGPAGYIFDRIVEKTGANHENEVDLYYRTDLGQTNPVADRHNLITPWTTDGYVWV